MSTEAARPSPFRPPALLVIAVVAALLAPVTACTPPCQPLTCEEAGAECGLLGDGCGGSLSCGDCLGTEVCGSGLANRCSPPPCERRSCASVGASCGSIDDGCGGTRTCGTCTNGSTCGADGDPNACGFGDCTPLTCEAQGVECGRVAHGCGGGTFDCGGCPVGRICRAGHCETCGTISWATTAAPFLRAHCTRCHTWAEHEQSVRARTPSNLRNRVASGNMPQEDTLSAEQKAPFLDWIDCGLP